MTDAYHQVPGAGASWRVRDAEGCRPACRLGRPGQGRAPTGRQVTCGPVPGLAGLLRSFRERAPRTLAALRGAVRAQDAVQVEQLAHSLKGSALNLGADGLGALCARLEASGRSSTTADLAPALERAEAELRLLDPVLQALAEELEPAQKPAGSWGS